MVLCIGRMGAVIYFSWLNRCGFWSLSYFPCFDFWSFSWVLFEPIMGVDFRFNWVSIFGDNRMGSIELCLLSFLICLWPLVWWVSLIWVCILRKCMETSFTCPDCFGYLSIWFFDDVFLRFVERIRLWIGAGFGIPCCGHVYWNSELWWCSDRPNMEIDLEILFWGYFNWYDS
jgi:hypothetical protein